MYNSCGAFYVAGNCHVYCYRDAAWLDKYRPFRKGAACVTDGVPSKVTFASFLQFRKASESMIITLLGMVTSVSGAPEKAAFANLCDSLWNVDIVFFSNVF